MSLRSSASSRRSATPYARADANPRKISIGKKREICLGRDHGLLSDLERAMEALAKVRRSEEEEEEPAD
jgi:hypothetical protein